MSYHQVQADMRVYVRRVYNAKLEGPPIPTGRGVWLTDYGRGMRDAIKDMGGRF